MAIITTSLSTKQTPPIHTGVFCISRWHPWLCSIPRPYVPDLATACSLLHCASTLIHKVKSPVWALSNKNINYPDRKHTAVHTLFHMWRIMRWWPLHQTTKKWNAYYQILPKHAAASQEISECIIWRWMIIAEL